VTLSGGNLVATKDSASWGTTYLTIVPTSGKWVIELTVPTQTVASPFRIAMFGVATVGFLKDGALLLGGGALDAGPIFIGVSQFDGVAGTFPITLNAGQSAFTSSNETLLSAFETANGVTYNRGLWTP